MMNLITEKQINSSGVVIYMAGAPASGKSEVVEHIKSTFGLIEINPDLFQEFLKKEKIQSDILNLKRLRNAIESKKGIIINYTGKSGQYENLILELEEKYGYKSFMIYMWIDDEEILKKREKERSKFTGRRVDHSYINDVLKSVRWNYTKYKNIFSKKERGFFLFNAYFDLYSVEYSQQINHLYHNIKNWLSDINKKNDNNNRLKKSDSSKSLKSFLKENKKDDQFFDKLVNDCSKIIDIYLSFDKEMNVILYRGTEKIKGDYAYMRYPINREPRDSHPSFHNFLNKYFKYKGFKTNRSNSTFVIPVKGIASDYGVPYAFFPENGFNFLWSPEVLDAYDSGEVLRRFEPIKKSSKLASLFLKLFPKLTEKEFYNTRKQIESYILKSSYNIIIKKDYNYYKEIYYSKMVDRNDVYVEVKISDNTFFDYSLFEIFPFLKNRKKVTVNENFAKNVNEHIAIILDRFLKEKQKIKITNIIKEKIEKEILTTLFEYIVLDHVSEYLDGSTEVDFEKLDLKYIENKGLYSAINIMSEIMFSGSNNESGFYLLNLEKDSVKRKLLQAINRKNERKE